MLVTLTKITKNPSPFLVLKKLHDEGLSERFSPWLYCLWGTTEPHPVRRAAPSADVKVQTSDETCEGVCSTNLHTSKFLLPSLSIADLNFYFLPPQLFGFSSYFFPSPKLAHDR